MYPVSLRELHGTFQDDHIWACSGCGTAHARDDCSRVDLMGLRIQCRARQDLADERLLPTYGLPRRAISARVTGAVRAFGWIWSMVHLCPGRAPRRCSNRYCSTANGVPNNVPRPDTSRVVEACSEAAGQGRGADPKPLQREERRGSGKSRPRASIEELIRSPATRTPSNRRSWSGPGPISRLV